jgi:hypothetical protein
LSGTINETNGMALVRVWRTGVSLSIVKKQNYAGGEMLIIYALVN